MNQLPKYNTFSIPAHEIYVDDEFNCRRSFTDDSVLELALSIDRDGLETPIVVQPKSDCTIPAEKEFRLITGHRRFRAMTSVLGMAEIPCQIRSGLSEHEALKSNLVENLERSDLSPLEEANAIFRLYPDCSTNAIATELNRNFHWVNDRLSLLEMPAQIQMKVATGKLTLYHIRQIASQPSADWQEVANSMENGTWTQRSESKKGTLLGKKGIARLIEKMLLAGLADTFGPRVASRCAGDIDDAEFQASMNLEIARRDACDKNLERVRELEELAKDLSQA
jgi:ParB/RepB/Spo0J family partition protein